MKWGICRDCRDEFVEVIRGLCSACTRRRFVTWTLDHLDADGNAIAILDELEADEKTGQLVGLVAIAKRNNVPPPRVTRLYRRRHEIRAMVAERAGWRTAA